MRRKKAAKAKRLASEKKQRPAWFAIANGGEVIERTEMPLWKAKAFAKAFNREAAAKGIEARAFAELRVAEAIA